MTVRILVSIHYVRHYSKVFQKFLFYRRKNSTKLY